jgi:hypothetical protein
MKRLGLSLRFGCAGKTKKKIIKFRQSVYLVPRLRFELGTFRVQFRLDHFAGLKGL